MYVKSLGFYLFLEQNVLMMIVMAVIFLIYIAVLNFCCTAQ